MERISRSDVKPKMTSSSAKPSAMKRLKSMADSLSITLQSSDILKRLGDAVARFPDEVVNSACHALEDAPQGDFRRLPTPFELVQACEKVTAKGKIGDCDVCDNMRLLVTVENGRTVAVRCECWKKWKAA